jgi:hypothetical protein
MSRPRLPKKPVELLLPDPVPEIKHWLIFGLDPSLSRTGYALMSVRKEDGATNARWLQVGSVAPDSSAAPVWVRSKQIAKALKNTLKGHVFSDEAAETGLIISMEFPTPQNDFLVALNRIIHLVFFDNPGVPFEKDDYSILSNNFATIRVLTPNAATMRSLMGLTMRGAKNKKENIEKAYTFLDRDRYPNLDTDACDGVLMAVMARHVASLLLGCADEVPKPFAFRYTNAEKETKGRGRNERIVTKGMLHRPEYWYAYEPTVYSLQWRDARQKTRTLERSQEVI